MADVAHLTDENRTLIFDKMAVMEQFLVEVRSKMDSTPKHEDLGYTLQDLENRQAAIEAEVTAILSQPPPKPEEEKK